MSALSLDQILAEAPEARPLWEGLGEGRLVLQRCAACRRLRFPPVASCPYCGTPGGDWEPVGTGGRLYSWVITHVPFDESLVGSTPYLVATVELDAGPRIFARLTNMDGREPSAGLAVEGYFHEEQGIPFVRFRPAGLPDV